jgi:aquaporin Z
MERSGRAEPGKAVTNAALGFGPLDNRGYDQLSALNSLLLHWPEYLMEAVGLGIFMLLVCAFATLLQHPDSPVRHALVSAFVRRSFMGLAVGATIVAVIMTPWGKQSGGHFNPAITLCFYRLGRIKIWDALFYSLAQFIGAASQSPHMCFGACFKMMPFALR